jgi:hypothetical protein
MTLFFHIPTDCGSRLARYFNGGVKKYRHMKDKCKKFEICYFIGCHKEKKSQD